MPAYAANIPAPTDLLCESCGYTLNGLPHDGNCPECGTPVAKSTVQSGRDHTPWESGGSFILTSTLVTSSPATFYRSLKTRVSSRKQHLARRFARFHWTIASILLTVAIVGHYTLLFGLASRPAIMAAIAVASFFGLIVAAWAVTEAVTRLTTWEASWRGYRLPLPVVRRALHYHAANLLPISLLVALIVIGYRNLVGYHRLDLTTSIFPYLYILSGTCIAGALYLFWTYWIAMRNLLYAND